MMRETPSAPIARVTIDFALLRGGDLIKIVEQLITQYRREVPAHRYHQCGGAYYDNGHQRTIGMACSVNLDLGHEVMVRLPDSNRINLGSNYWSVDVISHQWHGSRSMNNQLRIEFVIEFASKLRTLIEQHQAAGKTD